jgi:hypothetical protein
MSGLTASDANYARLHVVTSFETLRANNMSYDVTANGDKLKYLKFYIRFRFYVAVKS